MRFHAVFFDMGYTLTYFQPPMEEITLMALREAGISADPDVVRGALFRIMKANQAQGIEQPFPATPEYDAQKEKEMERSLLRELGYDDEAHYAGYHAAVERLFLQPGVIRLYDDVLPALEKLSSAGIRLGIISNWSWDLMDRCRQVGIADYFHAITASAYVGYNKPHPRIFQHALERIGVPPAQAVHVGDSYQADVQGAYRAGMTGILLDRDGAADHPDCPVFSNLTDVVDWVLNADHETPDRV